jgi:GT2 family glycosyltransferase
MDENKDIGVCGPKLLNENGTTQPSTRRFPTFRAALYRHTIFRSIGIFRKQYRRWLMKDFSHDEQTDVDQLMGACLLVRKSVLEEVGVLDEDFFMYYEEVDLCFRIKRAGYRVVFVPEAAIVHLGGRSAAQVPVRKRIAAMTSLLKFFKKHCGGFSTGLFACLFKPAVALKDVMTIVISSITYVFSAAVSNRKRCEKCSKEIKNSVQLLGTYSWLSLFKV